MDGKIPYEEGKRLKTLDGLRGVAILLMVIFHLAYDLTYFGHTQIDFDQDPFWFSLPRAIVFLFLLCVGGSLSIAYRTGLNKEKFWRRNIQIGLFALLISGSTYLFFSEQWIYFGTLHCIFFSSLLTLPLIQRPLIAGGLGGAMLIHYLCNGGESLPFWQLPHYSMDYVPLFPWLGASWLGSALPWDKIERAIQPWAKSASLNKLCLLGRHSLPIYLLHQPLLFGAIWAFSGL